MSYNIKQDEKKEAAYKGSDASPQTPLLYDIAAIQELYGANYSTRTEDDIYFWNGNEAFVQAIWDAGGVDTISCANQSLDAVINLNPGSFSSIGPLTSGSFGSFGSWSDGSEERATNNLAIAFEVKNSDGVVVNTIENALGGSGNDTITGNSVGNNLRGGSGDDKLDGQGGNDDLFGEAGDDTLLSSEGSDNLFGGTGDDTYIVRNSGQTITEYVDEGIDTLESSEDVITLGGNLENLTLLDNARIGNGNSLDNFITGNDAGNFIDGKAGDDFLEGGLGDDELFGGEGNDALHSSEGDDSLFGGVGDDIYFIYNSNQVITEYANEGIDTLASFEDITALGDNLESLVLLNTALNGNGNALGNSIIGNSNNNFIDGKAGDDILSGGLGDDELLGSEGNDTLYSSEGNDSLVGGVGDDTYIISNSNQTIVESVGEGMDLVKAFEDVTVLADNVENLALFDGARIGEGNSLSNVITGSEFDNILSGQAGNDVLNAQEGNDVLDGGLGDDAMLGGIGDDTYIVDSAADAITENISEGSDTVSTSISYALSDNLESLVLTGSNAINGTGNALDNFVAGNSANNILFGSGGDDTLTGNEGDDALDGGLGSDRMLGGVGNDTYNVDAVADSVIESLSEGVDTIFSGIGYSLGDNLENLILTGSNTISGKGNSFDNNITGNAAANYLYADDGNDVVSGGAGEDHLYGQAGNDLIFGGANRDWLIGDAGNDSLFGDRGKDWLVGDSGDDSLFGGADKDRLIGGLGDDLILGGAGRDWLKGGAGADKFIFSSRREGVDTITDFNLLQGDRILVSAKGFGRGLKAGKLSEKQFTLGSAATDASDRFIYDSATGGLFFDADGSDKGRQVKLAVLSPNLGLTSRNIGVNA